MKDETNSTDQIESTENWDEGFIWHQNFPRFQGWFDCKVDGEYARLQHWVCVMSGKHRWKRHDGSYELRPVEWTGEAEPRE